MIPNILIDKWMPILPLAEFRVLLYIARRTYGFHRDDVEMGMRLIAQGKPGKDRGTGLHPGTVSDAVKSLQARGLIRFTSGVRGRRTYQIIAETESLDCSEIPNSERADSPNSECAEIPNTKKRKSSSERKIERKGSPEQFGGTHQEEPPLSSLRVDDENPKPPRERLSDPKAEFVARLEERRHRIAVDANQAAALVAIELGNRDISWSDEFLEFEAQATTNPPALLNPIGHYRSLPKKFANKLAKAAIEEEMALRAPLEIKADTPCSCRGSGFVNFEPGNYCACKTGAELKRIEERSARDREKADSAAVSKTS